jgi:Tol biopolymer transport system component
MEADGSDLVRATANIAGVSGAAWSPDSTLLAWVSEEYGNSEIFIMDAQGKSVLRLTENSAQDSSPVWQP